MENRREVDRVDLSGSPCTVEARFDDRVAYGMGIDLNAKGLGATFETEPANVLPLLGEVGQLALGGDWLTSHLDLEARVVRRSDVEAGICLYGFEFLVRADEVGAALRRVFDPRQAPRFRPSAKPIEVVIADGPQILETATLRNISFTGIGLEVDIAQERRLGTSTEVELQLPLSPGEDPLLVPAAIRHRRSIGRARAVIGLVFLLPESNNPIQRAVDDYVMGLQRKHLVNAAQVREPSLPW